MTADINKQMTLLLKELWESQTRPQGPPLDFTRSLLLPPGDQTSTAPTLEQAEGMLMDRLGWPEWVRIYPRPAHAVLAASRLAKAKGLESGVLWMAPGTGAPFDPPRGEPGVAMLRGDWAPDSQAMLKAQQDARDQGLVLVLDEGNTAFRLAPGGAREYFGLDPDVAMYGPGLASGLDWAALAGRSLPAEPARKEPSAQALSAMAATLSMTAEPDFNQRLARAGGLFIKGLEYFIGRAGLTQEVRWEGPDTMPRLAGRRIWAFMELAREEGLLLCPSLMLDATFNPDQAPQSLWPRLARATARLRVLPEGEKAPLGWEDAAKPRTCPAAEAILQGLENDA